MPSAWPMLRHAWRPWRLGRRQLHGAVRRPTSKHWSFSLFAAGGLSWYAIAPYGDATCATCFGVAAQPHIQDIGYITDIEGDLETFNRYVDSGASVLRREDGVLKLKDPEKSAFVFGGDLFDRGPGDLRLAQELIELKRKHPERVFLIMGNRDINKMRLAAELSDTAFEQSPKEAFQPWWDPKAPGLTKYLSSKGLSDSKVNRLKWILRHTMGAPAAFEHRREELAEISGRTRAEVNDNEVLESFLNSVKSGGAVARYLQHAQIGVILHDTLFVHGAVEESALGFVPSRLTRYTNNTRKELRELPGAQSYDDLHGWIAALNQFAKDEVEAWLQRPDWSGKVRSRGGEALMAYQSRAASCLLTVVVSCYVDGKNMPTRQAIDQDKMEGFSKCSDPLSKKVVEYLHRADVRRVVVGHKPSGEAPAILRTRGVDGKGYEVISADTNYASSKDEQMRGQSWCEVRISQDSGHSQTRLRGQRPDGLGEYDFKLQVLGSDPAGDDGDALVGHQARYGKQWVWVRLKLNSGDYLLSRGYGRTAEYWAKKASEFQVVDFPPVLQKA